MSMHVHVLHCVRVLVQAKTGDKVHWERSSGVGIDGGEVGRRRATACKPQTGWLRRGCTQAQSCLCQGNYLDAQPQLVELPACRVANTLAPPFINGRKLLVWDPGDASCFYCMDEYFRVIWVKSFICISFRAFMFSTHTHTHKLP